MAKTATTYRKGQYVRLLGRLYLVDHHIDSNTLAVYCCNDFGPYGSQVWIDVDNLDEVRL
jgi:hypothetical protein